MTANSTGMPAALTIAGSDSGGGAGIQADLKTFAAHGVYGTSAITALTAQNTVGVQGVHEVPSDFVALQIESVVGDLGCDAVKTGMLATALIVEAVAAAVESLELPNLVVDPVMIAKSGDRLLDEEAVHAVRWTLVAAGARRDAEHSRSGGARADADHQRRRHARGGAGASPSSSRRPWS